MGNRLGLQSLLQSIIGVRSDGKENVYFQPPESSKMNYPCILYTLDSADTKFANNSPYLNRLRYSLTIIDKNPDSLIPGKIASQPMCLFNRHYTADNLNHFVYNIYY